MPKNQCYSIISFSDAYIRTIRIPRFQSGLAAAEDELGQKFSAEVMVAGRVTEEDLCGRLESGGVAAVADLTEGGWAASAEAAGLPYLRAEPSSPFVRAAGDLLAFLGSSAAVLILEGRAEFHRAARHVAGGRFGAPVILAHQEEAAAFDRLAVVSPPPAEFVVVGGAGGGREGVREGRGGGAAEDGCKVLEYKISSGC